MKQTLRFWSVLTGLLVVGISGTQQVQAEGSKQLTPNTAGTPTDLTQPTNTRAGFLTHDAVGTENVSLGFLKPASWGTAALPFSENYRMYIRLKPGETLNYGVRRLPFGTSTYTDLMLTLRFGNGDGTIVRQTTLVRDQNSPNQATLVTSQPGVIATAAQALAGPNTLAGPGGYQPLTYTNTTGSTQDFFVEYTQVGEFTNTGTQPGFNDLKLKATTTTELRSEYDFWDFTVVGTDGLEKPGRLFSRFWAFTAGTSTGAVDNFRNRLSATFKLFPLVESKQAPGQFYVKEVELAGMRPLVFFYVTNEFGSAAINGDQSFATRRKSQISNTAYAQYPNFVNNPDETIWPSAPTPTVSVTPQPFCRDGNTQVAFTTSSAENGQFDILIDLNGTMGYQPNTRDVLIFQPITAGVNSTVVWNGLDGLGARVTPTNQVIDFQFTSNGAAFNFPVYDAEGNPDGFRVRNVRPANGSVFDRLYWDDSNLDATRFPGTRVELAGQVSTNGVHLWGATNNDGNAYTVNTWTYGFAAFTGAQNFTYANICDTDGDGVADDVDIDDDNDGILDVIEAFSGSTSVNPNSFRTSTSAIAYLDAGYVHPVFGAFLDTNNDGVNDYFDTDRDGIPNHFDLDSDGDGIPDAVEANGNVVPTGIFDQTVTLNRKRNRNADPEPIATYRYYSAYDASAGKYVTLATATATSASVSAGVGPNGLPDLVETSVTYSATRVGDADSYTETLNVQQSGTSKYILADSDQDVFTGNAQTTRNYNFLDIDSDNDGITDNIEAQSTASYRPPSGLDTDRDGLDNAYDANNGGTALGSPVNSDADAVTDMFDTDSDGDNAGKSSLPIFRQTSDWSEGFDTNLNGVSGDEIVAKARQFATKNPSKANYYPLFGNSPLSLFLQDANNNGIPNFLEPGNTYYHDDNFNGLVDIYDPAYGGAPSTAPKAAGATEAAFRSIAAQVPLPVSLLDFRVVATGTDALLRWATAQELNNTGFDIERSADGRVFAKVNYVAGQGTTSNRTDYVLTDKGAGLQASTWFYRLRQVDRDGTASFSPVRVVSFTGTTGPAQLLAYPNPAHNAVQVVVLGTVPAGPLQVFDAVGRLVRSQQAPTVGTEVALQLTGLPSGVYVLRCGMLSQRITVE